MIERQEIKPIEVSEVSVAKSVSARKRGRNRWGCIPRSWGLESLSVYFRGSKREQDGDLGNQENKNIPLIQLGFDSGSSSTTTLGKSDSNRTTLVSDTYRVHTGPSESQESGEAGTVDLFARYRIEDSSEKRFRRHEEFFGRIIHGLGLKKVENAQFLSIMHMFPDAKPFVRAMGQLADVGMIIPKPNSKRADVVEGLVKEGYHIVNETRESIGNITGLISTDKRTVFGDHGGYFSPIIADLQGALGDNFAGVFEHTENGHQRYLTLSPDFPFYSVARSPLKEYEDRKVGRNIAYATVSVLESIGVNIKELKNGTIGYGKLGRAYSKTMRGKGVEVVVSELRQDRINLAEEEEFEATDTNEILSGSDLICVANGEKAITGKQFTSLKKGAYITAVTSHDDAFDRSWLDSPESGYEKTKHSKSEYVTLYNNPETGHYFHLITDGNPVNLVLKIPVGDTILFVHAESLVAMYRLLTNRASIGEYNVDDETRNGILGTWIDIFGKEALEEDYDEYAEEIDDIDKIRPSRHSEFDNSKGDVIFQSS